MNDSEIEDLLRKYRPIGPPARLRERVLAVAPLQLIWPWMTAAAVLLVTATALDVAAASEATKANVRLGAAVPVVDELAARLGGGADARELAELMVIEQQVRSETASMAATDSDVPRGEQQ